MGIVRVHLIFLFCFYIGFLYIFCIKSKKQASSQRSVWSKHNLHGYPWHSAEHSKFGMQKKKSFQEVLCDCHALKSKMVVESDYYGDWEDIL